MAYSKALAERIRQQLARRRNIEEKRMFGGVGYLLDGNMCVGVWKESLVVRVGPNEYQAALREPFVSEFDITGRPMTGWVLIGREGVADDDQLYDWIERSLRFARTLPSK
jgi:TfoX/Sxy family transcriptional regulator of competence genes